MTSPDLIRELTASRPAAPEALRARVREITATKAPARQAVLLAEARPTVCSASRFPAVVAITIVSAGVAAESHVPARSTTHSASTGDLRRGEPDPSHSPASSSRPAAHASASGLSDQSSLTGQGSHDGDRAGHHRAQRMSATLTVEVANSDGVSRAAQKALDLTKSLGGHVVSATVATGEQGNAALVVRVPVDKVQEAIVQLSALGRIASQQVTIDDLQGNLDRLARRERSVRAQIAIMSARLESESLDAPRAHSSRRVCKTLRQRAPAGSGATPLRRMPRRAWRRSSCRSSLPASSAPSRCPRGSTGRWTRRSTSSSGRA